MVENVKLMKKIKIYLKIIQINVVLNNYHNNSFVKLIIYCVLAYVHVFVTLTALNE